MPSDLKHDTTQVQQWLTDISATRGLNGLNDGFDLAAQYREHFETTIAALKALHPEGLSTLDALHQRFIPTMKQGSEWLTLMSPTGRQAKSADGGV